MYELLLRSAEAGPTLGAVDIALGRGRIAAITPPGVIAAEAAVEVIDLAGRVVIPAFVEPHLHLDKAYLGAGDGNGGLGSAIARTAELKAAFTAADVRARATRVLSAALANGTTAIRAQTEVDPGVGLLSVHVLAELAEQFADVLRLQIAVFPQEGILSRPGTLDLMREGLRIPGSIVGGCPYSERTVEEARAHVDIVLDLALEHGVPADLHLDLADDASDARFALAAYVAGATIDRGLRGRVTIGHATTLASLDLVERGRVLEQLADAQVAVAILPATDLYLVGRNDTRNIRRGVAPLAALWNAGVATAVSSNNLRNAFTPTGRADPLDMALLLARVSHLSTDEEFSRVLGMATTAGARILDPDAVTGLVVGAPANLVVLDTLEPASVVLDQPDRFLVVSMGQVVYAERKEISWTGPAARLAGVGGS